jgi:uncharacterized protein (TIGR02646 family)
VTMKPVHKGSAPRRYSSHGEAKPDLIEQLGPHCSYCEAYGAPTALDVEHIYPQKSHGRRKNSWDNFLLACKSCNSKKNIHLGSGRQRALDQRYLWPHIDNTARAFRYFSDGRVSPEPSLPPPVQRLAARTMEMVGFLSKPPGAKPYTQRSIAYTGISIREEIWRVVASFRTDYMASPQPARARSFATIAVRIGYFSIWMEVFRDRPEFRGELITAFKAAPQCFDQNTQALPRGRA